MCVTGTDYPPPLWNVDDVTRVMSKGGACECPRVGAFFNLMTSRGQCPGGGGACECLHPPPPFRKSRIRACIHLVVIRDANFSICQVVMIAEGNRRMPKAFVGGGYERGASPLSLGGGGVWGFSTRIFFLNYMLFGAFWSNLSTNLKPYGYMIFHNKIQIFLHCPE